MLQLLRSLASVCKRNGGIDFTCNDAQSTGVTNLGENVSISIRVSCLAPFGAWLENCPRSGTVCSVLSRVVSTHSLSKFSLDLEQSLLGRGADTISATVVDRSCSGEFAQNLLLLCQKEQWLLLKRSQAQFCVRSSSLSSTARVSEVIYAMPTSLSCTTLFLATHIKLMHSICTTFIL